MSAIDITTQILLFGALYVEIFFLLTFLEHKDNIKSGYQTLTNSYFPTVTVMVPVWNEEKTITKTLDSLLSLDYPKEKLSIFVINDGSTDNTAEILNNLKSNHQVRIFHKNNGGKYTALNLGLNNAKSELVGCLDADSYVKSDALLHIVKNFENKEVMSVVPSIKVHEPKTILQYLQAAEYMLSIFMRYVFCAMGTQYITPGPFSFFRREVFLKLGNYRQAHNTEDMEIALRMQGAGMKIVNAHKAHVLTTSPNNFSKLYKQRVRWYHGSFQNLLDYKHLFFRKNLGLLGLFILPVVVLSIFTVFYMLGQIAYYGVERILDKIYYFNAINWQVDFTWRSFNFINNIQINTIQILAILGLFIAAVSILIGKYISEEKVRVDKNMIIYFLLYGFIMPLWFIKPLFNTILRRKSSWR